MKFIKAKNGVAIGVAGKIAYDTHKFVFGNLCVHICQNSYYLLGLGEKIHKFPISIAKNNIYIYCDYLWWKLSKYNSGE
jgi:hypothetical protein